MKRIQGVAAKAIVVALYILIFMWASITGKGYLFFVDNKARDGVYTFSIKLDKATSVTVPAGSVKSLYVKGTGAHHIIVTKSGTTIFEGTLNYPKGTKAAMIDGALIDNSRKNDSKTIVAQAVPESLYSEPEQQTSESTQDTAAEVQSVNP
ncbi:MAG TPA: hypothetical protein P5519_11005 [Spirochaetia bacterium]|nr:hypothetical protein [Spirochaetia bacterium]